MRRRRVQFTWEDARAQAAFREWVPFPGAETSAREVDRFEELFSLTPPMRVLDVGCGNGRHALQLAQRGYRVLGIDVAQLFLDEAESAAREAGVELELRLQRASELTERGAFDFALAYWHTIGFMTEEEIAHHFGAIHNAMADGAAFLYVSQGPKLLPPGGATAKAIKNWSEKNGRFILSEKSLSDGYRTEYSIVIDTESSEIIEYVERQKAFACEDVLDYLRAAGFSKFDAWADLNGTPATPEQFGVFVCQK